MLLITKDLYMPSNDVLTIIGVMITLFGSGFTLMLWALNRIDSDVKAISERVDKLSDRVDKLGNRMDGHASRIDQLYTMFIDLVKHNKE